MITFDLNVSVNGTATAVLTVADDENHRTMQRKVCLRSRDEIGGAVDEIESTFGPAAAGDAHTLLDDAAQKAVLQNSVEPDSDAEAVKAGSKPDPAPADFQSFRQLAKQFPELRPAVLDGLLRQGETLNLIAAPKTGKSWLVTSLALAVATGRAWLNRFQTTQGDVLILDNELHGETSSNRVPKVASALGIMFDAYADRLHIKNMRGQLRDVRNLEAYFSAIEPGRFKIIILDAFYRFLPADVDENSNGAIASIYNLLDRYADRLQCCFVLIHHSSKGLQNEKSVTDVGAGAGSQSRATDCHLVLRQHEENDVVVLDAAVRSWKPVEPVCLRWEFPTWTIDESLDPTDLRKAKRRTAKVDAVPVEPEIPWTPERFVSTFVTSEPKSQAIVLAKAECLMSVRTAKRWLDLAVDSGIAFRWYSNTRDRLIKIATIPQPVLATGKGEK